MQALRRSHNRWRAMRKSRRLPTHTRLVLAVLNAGTLSGHARQHKSWDVRDRENNRELCSDHWHKAASTAIPKKRIGRDYRVWLRNDPCLEDAEFPNGRMWCPTCGHGDDIRSTVVIAGITFPFVSLLDDEHIAAEIPGEQPSDDLFQTARPEALRSPSTMDTGPMASNPTPQAYRQQSLAKIHPLEESIVWAEHARSYATGAAYESQTAGGMRFPIAARNESFGTGTLWLKDKERKAVTYESKSRSSKHSAPDEIQRDRRVRESLNQDGSELGHSLRPTDSSPGWSISS